MSRPEAAPLKTSTLVSAFTGVVYFVMKSFLRSDDPFSALGHPWQPHVLAAHLLIGPVVVFALGLIAREHVVERYRTADARRGRNSGTWLVLLGALMIFSGYLLEVVTDPGPRRLLVTLHLGGGLLFALLFLAHFRLAGSRKVVGSSVARGGQAAPRRLVIPPGRGIR